MYSCTSVDVVEWSVLKSISTLCTCTCMNGRELHVHVIPCVPSCVTESDSMYSCVLMTGLPYHNYRFVKSDHSKSLAALSLLLTCMYTGELLHMCYSHQVFSRLTVL